MLVGVQFLPVMSDEPAPEIRNGLLRSRVIVMIANATADQVDVPGVDAFADDAAGDVRLLTQKPRLLI